MSFFLKLKNKMSTKNRVELIHTSEPTGDASNKILATSVAKKSWTHNMSTKAKTQQNFTHVSKREEIEHLFKINIRNEFGVGLIKVVTNPHIVIKLFWIFSLLGSLAIISYLIVGNVSAYFQSLQSCANCTKVLRCFLR